MAELLELVQRATRRDPDAFAALIERFERSALAVAFAQLHDAHRAGDAVQEAFLRAWQELPRLEDPTRFAGWMMQIVRNAAIDLRRRIRPALSLHGPDGEAYPNLPAADPGPLRQLAAADDAALVQSALAKLDETTRAAVVLRYYEGLSAKEIGEALGLSPAAVDMRLSRARGQLKFLLSPLLEEATA